MRNIPAGDEAESIRQERDSLFSLLGLTLSSGGDPLPRGEYRLKIDTSARGMETAVEDRRNEPHRLYLRVPFADSGIVNREPKIKERRGGRGKK